MKHLGLSLNRSTVAPGSAGRETSSAMRILRRTNFRDDPLLNVHSVFLSMLLCQVCKIISIHTQFERVCDGRGERSKVV